MFVHVKYGNERGDCMMEFSSNSNSFTTVNNVIEKVRPVYGRCCSLQLYNEHRRELHSKEVVENALSVYGRGEQDDQVQKRLFLEPQVNRIQATSIAGCCA